MSAAHDRFELAQRHIPGGVNSPVRAFKGVGGDPVFVDSAAGIASVFPRGGRSNRILRGDTAPTITLAATTVDANGNPSTTGIEQLLFLAQPAREGAPEADFRFLAQPGISTARGNGGGLAGILAVAGFVAPKARGAMTLDVGDGDSRGAAAILSWRLVRDQ